MLKIKKIIVFGLIFSVAITQVFSLPVASAMATAYAVEFEPVDPADADNSPETIYDLVALVVDTQLDQDNTSYQGLRDDGYADSLDDLKLGHRIVRYAEDLKDNNDLTDVKILFFNKQQDSVTTLTNALENLYRNGDGSHNNRLSGVVLIGDIPLPVVNKNGNRYISLFPYTDFSEKAYIYNASTQSFERNTAVNFPKPEIWHGVIKAPSNNAAGMEHLAEFFDKNHLYYEGEPMFAEFDRKLFFGDLIHEEEQVNQDVYAYYIKYLEALEDLAYFRYNKFWANELMGDITGDLPVNPDHPSNQPQADGSPSFAENLQSDNPLGNLPDIYSKPIIDQALVPYFRLLNRYIAKVNDWADYTGRYRAAEEVHSVPALISMKDEYTKFYLRSVNDALEKKLNEVASKIEEPLPLLDYTEINGDYDGNDFDIGGDEGIYFRFHYQNEEVGKFYINGVDSNIIEGAKQCLPYLGSTKSEYFDDDLNFNPKIVNGVYSILTRALRSDNPATGVGVHSAGVNTRMLSPEELVQATDGAYSGNIGGDGIYETGAVIEDNPDYGISAFIDNPLYYRDEDEHYKGPFEQEFEKGDVIVKVNGKNLSYAYTFEKAIEDSFKAVEKVIKTLNSAAQNDPDDITEMLSEGVSPIAGLSNFPYKIAFPGGDEPEILDNPNEIIFNEELLAAVMAASLFDDSDDPVIDEGQAVAGVISVEYYRDGERRSEVFTFTVSTDDDDEKVLFTSREDPQDNGELPGDLQLVIILSSFGLPIGFGFGDDTDGAIFTLYNNKDVGYNGNAYDNSAGCNANSTAKNSDRCFPMVASMPVLDPAGSLAPVKTTIPGVGNYLLFPEKVKRNSENLNSPHTDDYSKHAFMFQFPGGKDFEEVDSVYYDACYKGLPTIKGSLDSDSNPYDFVLDADTEGESGDDEDISTDLYGKFLDSIGEFVGPGEGLDGIGLDGDDAFGDDLAGEIDYSANWDTEDETDDNAAYQAAVRAFNPSNDIWLDIDNVRATSVVLNDGTFGDPDDPRITLYDFAKRYGIIDGIDNDDDGLADWEWRDTDNDGDFEKFYDYDEANSSAYGLENENLNEIARKLLSHDSTYTIPYGRASFPYDDFDEDITLEVDAHSYGGRELNSMIIHNEPTDYTIAQQIKSMTALSLPIDNPRYVAFQSLPSESFGYFVPGKIEKIEYINLFDDNLPNLAQLQADLRAKANEIALIPGSYRIFGPGAGSGDYSLLEISNEIYNEYFAPVIGAALDNPIDGFDLVRASTDKLHDALQWKSMNIDDKHEYILKYYLNGEAATNAYINDASLFPAPFGFEPAYGYEAAYLVLDGERDYFDMNFNKDLPVEENPAFDPLQQILEAAEEGAGDGGAGGEEAPDSDDFEFVWLDQFLTELQEFIAGFSSVPEFEQACGFLPDFGDSGQAAALASLPLNRLEVTVDKEVLTANGSDRLTVTVLGLDENDNLVDYNSNNEIINLEVNQNEVSPIFSLVDSASKTLSSGTVSFTLNTTENTGTVTISASSSASDGISGIDVESNVVQVTTTGSYINLYSYTFNEIVGAEELLRSEGEDGEDGEDGEGGDGGDGGEGGEGDRVIDEEGAGGGDDSGDDEGGEDGSGGGESDVSEGFVGDLERILTGLAEEEAAGTGDGRGAGDDSDDGIGGEGGGDETGDEGETDEGETDEGETGDGETVDGDLTILTSEEAEWEQYFVVDEYYKKFLVEGEEEASVRRLLVSLPNDQNPFIDAQNEGSRYLVENSDSFVADGQSLMKVDAQIFNISGRIETDRQHTVRFRIEDVSVGLAEDEIVTFENGNTATSSAGVATVYLRAGTKTGQFKIFAEVLNSSGGVDRNYPTAVKDLYLVAGEPTSVEIQSDSYVLVANEQSKTTINFILKDRFGNTANNSFYQVAVFAEGPAELDETADVNGAILGNQISTFEGIASIDLLAKDETGEVNLIALVLDPELEDLFLEMDEDFAGIDFENHVGSARTFEVLENTDLQFFILNNNFEPVSSISANGSSIARLGVKLLADGQTVREYSGPINLKLLNENLGNFVNDPPEKMSHGELNPANIAFRSSTLAGEVEILVDIPGFVTDTLKFKTLPGSPEKIEMIASENSIYTGGQNEAVIFARLLDRYNNLVDTNNGTTINFSATEATNALVEFAPSSALTLNGVASTTVLGGAMSGTANIIAEAEEGGSITDGTLSLKVNKHVTSDDVEDFSPRALYVSLMGGSFGIGEDNITEALLFNGQTQAVSGLTASPDDKKRLISVDGYGKIDLLSETVKANVAGATDSFPYQKVIFADNLDDAELANIFVVPEADSEVRLLEAEVEEEVSEDGAESAAAETEILPLPEDDGIYIQRLSKSDETITVTEKDDGIYLEQSEEIKVKIDEFGRIFINDASYKLKLPDASDKIQTSEFSLIVSHNTEPTLLVSFKQNFDQDVQILPADSALENFFPGIYLQLKGSTRKYALAESFSRASTNEPKGFYLVDLENKIDSSHAPGFSYDSQEKAREKFGLGFTGNNKHMLLFSAGNSVGESNMAYASEVGITYGDPMIRLEVEDDLISDASGYSKDIGKSVFTGQQNINEMISFDINGDSYDDLLLVYEDGFIRLLENEISNKRFYDRGNILQITNGIFGLTKIDVNNDSYDDLVVGTKESCNVGEECISLFTNYAGNFVRETLNLDLNGKKALEMKAADMNADGCEDLVLADSAGQINIYYNQIEDETCSGLDTTHGYLRSFGVTVNSEANLVDTLFVHYNGIEQPDADGENHDKFIQFMLPSNSPSEEAEGFASDAGDFQEALSGSGEIASSSIPPQTYPKEFNFIHIKEEDRLADESTKEAIDINAGSVAVGDQVNYIIALKNNSGSNINNLMLSDLTPTSMSLQLPSLTCLDAGCPDDLSWIETGTSLRSHVISGISVPAGGQRIIQYTMTVSEVPEVHFDLGKDFTTYPSDNDDPYVDILVKPEVNPDGILTYLYSTGVDYRNRVQYEKFEVVPTPAGGESLLSNLFEEQGLPNPLDLLAQASEAENADDPENVSLSPSLEDSLGGLNASQSYDRDYDGCSDLWDGAVSSAGAAGGAAGAVANGIESALSKLRCSGGGCVPIPYNKAFLAPDGAVPGIATVAWGIPSLPPVLPAYPSQAPSSGRFYLSPTLTLGLGTAVCIGPGPGHLSPCFAFAVPGGVPGVCGAIRGGIGAVSNAIAKSKNSLIDPATGQAAIISDGEGAGTSDDIELGRSFGGGSDDLGSVGAKANIKIPGFPSVITNWMDKQMDEIYNKLLDFPTFYFILPDIGPFISENIKGFSNVNLGDEIRWQSFHDFATSLSSIPLIEIEGREILIRLPAISKKEIDKYKDQGRLWLEHMEREIDRFTSFNCDLENLDPERRNLCDKILLDINELVRSVEKLLNLLDQIANLPRQILNWRYLEAKYATQIICYLDAIMTFTGGYIKKQQKIVESWMKAVQDTIRAFQSWKLILDVIVEYQVSCDQCKNDRFSKLGLLLQLFVAIPEPPVVPLPKWPDIIVDLSQIKTGIKILWPDVVFHPQPILLPDLPIITLPDLIPELTVSIPGFDVPDFPEFVLPNLPDLPPLPLPKLPDLPRPPKIPNLPGVVAQLLANLKPIFKILCLLKNGLIPVPEGFLATEIETLTQPSIQVVIPLIKSLAVQTPEIQYDYVKEIKLTGKFNFDIDASVVYLTVARGAEIWNKAVKKVVENINKITRLPYGQIVSNAIQKAVDAAAAAAKEAAAAAVEAAAEAATETLLDSGSGTGEGVEGIIRSGSGDGSGDSEAESSLPLDVASLQSAIDQLTQELALEEDYPETYYLTATQTFLDKNHPLLNRSLEEIEANIKIEDLPDSPYLRQLANLRNDLVAYTKGLTESNKLLESIDDYDSFTRILVENDKKVPRTFAEVVDSDTVSGDTGGGDDSTTTSVSFFGQAIEELLLNAATVEEEDRRLLAAEIDTQAGIADLVSGSGEENNPTPVGFYIVADGVNENVLNYVAELKRKTNIIFSDADHDDDTDIILAMGGDVYLKENHINEPDLPSGNVIIGAGNNAVGDFVVAGGSSVQGFTVANVGNGKVDLNWLPSSDAASYEITLESQNGEENYTFPADFENENQAASLVLLNGNYYAHIYSINAEDERSIISDRLILAPQSCADKEPPSPAVSATEYKVPILKDLEIDASNSFDADGEIVEYYLEVLPYESDKTDPVTDEPLRTTVLPANIWSDLNVVIDSDGDGIAANDRNNPKFKIGPFINEGDIGVHEVILHVVDQSGNSSSQNIRIIVFAPEITLDEALKRTPVASGTTEPIVAELPFWLMRNRYIYRSIDGALKLIPRIDKVVSGTTDQNGNYNLSDFNLENMILVENAEKEIIAEIHPETGNIGALEDGYSTVARPAVIPSSPTHVDIVGDGDELMGSVYLIADSNNDVQIHSELGFNSENYRTLYGVNADDINSADEFIFISLPADDLSTPGGALLINQTSNENLVLIDTSGNIIILDERITLTQKQNDHIKDPLIIEIRFNGRVVAEVLISPLGSNMQIVARPDVPFTSPRSPSAGTLYNSRRENVAGLVLDPKALVKRREFVRVLIEMLCIVPRPEAYEPYEPGTGYSDIVFNEADLTDYAYIKEGTLLGLVEGYKGEPNSAGLLPFKPESTITRAEATKIILEALEMKNLIDLSTVTEGVPWYSNFMQISQDFGGPARNNFINTPEEAANPNKEMTFEELTTMVERVLTIYDCYNTDQDNDGMSDFCEAKYGVDDPDEDRDNDNLSNADDCYYRLDPTDFDTDDGGVLDGDEIIFGTNALDPMDDPKDDDHDGLTNLAETTIHKTDPFDPDSDDGSGGDGDEVYSCRDPLNPDDDEQTSQCKDGSEGIYIVPPDCNSCPCLSTFLNKADIVEGDIFFPTILRDYENYYESRPFEKTYIFEKGNEVTVESVNK